MSPAFFPDPRYSPFLLNISSLVNNPCSINVQISTEALPEMTHIFLKPYLGLTHTLLSSNYKNSLHSFSGTQRQAVSPVSELPVLLKRHGEGCIYNSRLSNDPIKPLNRKAMDLQRHGRGRYQNFEHFSNTIFIRY